MPGQVNPLVSSVNSTNVWDVVAERSGVQRKVCKEVIFGLLYGSDVVTLMCHNSLTLADVTAIREAFDNFTQAWSKGR